MAMKIYGDKIVFPDNSEQTSAPDPADTSYTKAEIDAQQKTQDDAIVENNDDIARQQIEISNQQTSIDKNTSDIDTDSDRITANTTEIAKKIDDAPDDGETYARNNKTWVGISDSSGIPDAPVDGLQYGRQDGEWTEVTGGEAPADVYTKEQTDDLLDEKADKATTYTKTEQDVIDNAQDENIATNLAKTENNALAIGEVSSEVATNTADIAENTTAITANDGEIVANTNNIATNSSNIAKNTADIVTNAEAIASIPSPVDAYTKTESDAINETQDSAIETNTTNIGNNTTNIGLLSGKVTENSEEIERLNEASYFSSGYTVGYPGSPNRPPQTGELYMQNNVAFTFSYSECNAIFLSNTDQMGNVRAFTAITEGDIISLNEIDSPNYGRYTVEMVIKNEGYTVLQVVKVLTQGSVINGSKMAVQAFPGGESANSIWDNVGGVATYDGNVDINGALTLNGTLVPMDGGINLQADTLNMKVVAESATVGTGVVGTFSPHSVQIYTDSGPRMTLNTAGSVGFLTTPNDDWNTVSTGRAGGHLVQLNGGGWITASTRSDNTSICGVRNTDGNGTIALNSIDGDKLIINQSRCDIQVPLFVQGTPKSVQETFVDFDEKLAIKDKLIEKLTERLDALEKRVK